MVAGIRVQGATFQRQRSPLSSRWETLKSGRMPGIEQGAEEMWSRRSRTRGSRSPAGERDFQQGSGDSSHRTRCDNFSIRNAGHPGLHRCAGAALRDGQLLVLRSTLYPGTTGLDRGHIQFAGKMISRVLPERIVQDLGSKRTGRSREFIAAHSPEGEQEGRTLLKAIAPELVTLHPIEAEFEKCSTMRIPLHRIRGNQSVRSHRKSEDSTTTASWAR